MFSVSEILVTAAKGLRRTPVFLFALAVEPLIGPLLGRGWRQIEVFGVAPDPTAIGTLGIAPLAAGRAGRVLLVLPAIWCVISGVTLWAMEAPDAWVPPMAAILAVFLSVGKRRLLLPPETESERTSLPDRGWR